MVDEDLAAGIYTMGITPFTTDGHLDEGAFREHVRRLSDEGVSVLPGSAQTGEAPLMSDEEVWRTWELTVEVASERFPIIAANREFSTVEGNLRFASEAKRRGVSAVQIYPLTLGHSMVPSTSMLRGYYDEVLSTVDMPVLLSSNIATGFEVPLQVHRDALDKYTGIIGFYKNHPDVRNLSKFMSAIGGRKPILTPCSQMMASYALGSVGQLDNIQNIAPRLCRSLHDAYLASDIAAAAERYAHLVRMIDVFTSFADEVGAPTMVVYKAILRMLGLPAGYPRKPFPSLTGNEVRLREIVASVHLCEYEGYK